MKTNGQSATDKERQQVEAIRRKLERGEVLSSREERALAYSPLGSAAGCPATAFYLASR